MALLSSTGNRMQGTVMTVLDVTVHKLRMITTYKANSGNTDETGPRPGCID